MSAESSAARTVLLDRRPIAATRVKARDVSFMCFMILSNVFILSLNQFSLLRRATQNPSKNLCAFLTKDCPDQLNDFSMRIWPYPCNGSMVITRASKSSPHTRKPTAYHSYHSPAGRLFPSPTRDSGAPALAASFG